MQQAQSSGQPAEVVTDRTEDSDTWANPDGTFSVKRYGTAVRLWRDGAWVPADPTLEFAGDGTVVPKAATVAVNFSGGGTGPLLTGAKDGRTLTLTWPTALPKPTLSGDVATYANVLPDVDLQLKAEVDGFSQLLVVKTAQAAKNPNLTMLKYKMNTVGLTVATDPGNGSINATDPAGQTVFTSPSPLMWDSTSSNSSTGKAAVRTAKKASRAAVNTDGPAPPAPGDDFVPPPGAQNAQMPTSVSGDTLQITPDQGLLAGAKTQYPVFIDPSWAWGKRQDWAWAYRPYPDTSFWNANQDARVGYEADTNGLSRSFFQMDTSALKGADIMSSVFRIRDTWTWSCTKTPVELWQTGPISAQTTWNNQPSQIAKLATVTDAKGWSSDCPAGNLEFDTTSKIQQAASQGWSSITLGLYASNESDPDYWKRFDPKTAVLETKYNHPPKTPYKLGTNPKTSCSSGGLIGNTTVGLYATIDDPDGGNLTAQFQLFKAGSSTPSLDQSVPAMKGRVATLSLPEANTGTGDYQWKVRARDNDGAYSAWSETCKFSVDRTRPAHPPKISSPEFPDGSNGWPTNTSKARTTGHLTIDPNGVSDVDQYGWYTDYDPTVKYVNASTLSSAPPTFSPPGYGPHFLYAFSVDKAGNRSDTAIYVYYAASSGIRDIPGDLNGDGNNDIWSVDSNGTLLTYAGQGNGQFSAATNGGMAFDNAQVTSRGDWGQDGYNDLVALQPDPNDSSKKNLGIYPNNGTGVITNNYAALSVACPTKDVDTGCDYGPGWTGDDHWHDADQIIAVGDINGDGQPDLLVKEGKHLWAYYGSRSMYLDRVSEPILVGGNDWDKYTVIAPGDVNGDGIPDLWLRENATGDIYLAPGKVGEKKGIVNPATWGDPASLVKIGSGVPASVYPTVGSSGDITGDGIPDLWARKTDNTMVGWYGKKPGADNLAFSGSFVIDGITGGARIPTGTTLTAGQSFTSRSAKLTMGSDGNLTITSNAGKTIWSTNTAGNPGATATMQPDGNFVVYKPDGSTALWSSKTSGAGGYALLQDRGNLVVYNVKGQSQWSSNSLIRHDYNGSGRSGMAAWYAYGDGSVSIQSLLTNSDGTFNPPTGTYSAPKGTWYTQNMKFATGDFNGDGQADVAALYGYADGSVTLFTWLSKPGGGFNPPIASWSAGPGQWSFSRMTLQAGDFNGDGRDDLAVWYNYADGSNTLFTFTATPQGRFNPPFASWDAPSGWNGSRVKLVTGDFTGDGRDDLAALYDYADGSVTLFTFPAAPTGGFNNPIQGWTSTNWGSWDRIHLYAGHFTGDGRDDVAVWYDYADGHDGIHTFVSASKGDGTFNTPYQSWNIAAGNYYYPNMQLVPGDYNGDGRDDLGAMYFYDTGEVKMLTWLTNPNGKFNDPVGSWEAPTGQWHKPSARFLGTSA
ncbi:FG-GAP-like repeat-containing protein [Streptomyces sp. NPDC020096]